MINSVRALWRRYVSRSRADTAAIATVRRIPERRRVLIPVCDDMAIWLWIIPGLPIEADAIEMSKASSIDGVFARIERGR